MNLIRVPGTHHHPSEAQSSTGRTLYPHPGGCCCLGSRHHSCPPPWGCVCVLGPATVRSILHTCPGHPLPGTVSWGGGGRTQPGGSQDTEEAELHTGQAQLQRRCIVRCMKAAQRGYRKFTHRLRDPRLKGEFCSKTRDFCPGCRGYVSWAGNKGLESG